MRTVYSEQHKLRDAKTELYNGELVLPFESPMRVEYVLQEVREVNLGEIIEPRSFEIEAICRLHNPDYSENRRKKKPPSGATTGTNSDIISPLSSRQ